MSRSPALKQRCIYEPAEPARAQQWNYLFWDWHGARRLLLMVLLVVMVVVIVIVVFVIVSVCFIVYVCVCAFGPPWPSTLRSGAWIDEVHAAMTITQGAWRYI